MQSKHSNEYVRRYGTYSTEVQYMSIPTLDTQDLVLRQTYCTKTLVRYLSHTPYSSGLVPPYPV